MDLSSKGVTTVLVAVICGIAFSIWCVLFYNNAGLKKELAQKTEMIELQNKLIFELQKDIEVDFDEIELISNKLDSVNSHSYQMKVELDSLRAKLYK